MGLWCKLKMNQRGGEKERNAIAKTFKLTNNWTTLWNFFFLGTVLSFDFLHLLKTFFDGERKEREEM